MKVKVLVDGAECEIVAILDGDDCPAEDFMNHGDAATESAREGLALILQHVADKGIQNVPTAWFHEANKKEKINEFIKGPLRLFFFKGSGRQIAVCTTGVRKKGNKADKAAVKKAAAMRKQYEQAVEGQTLKVIKDED